MSFYSIKKESAFTLVEIIVVVLIMSTLAAISIPTYYTLRSRAREIATKAEMRTIATGLELYNTMQEQYPLTEGGLDTLRTAEIVAPVPANDKWEMPYAYTSDGQTYELRSSGVDKTLATDDDIAFVNGIMTELGRFSNSGVELSMLYTSTFDDLEGINLWYGDWEISDGKLSPSLDWAYHRVYFEGSSGTDYSITANATINEGMGYGIYYRMTPSDEMDGYVFQYDPGLGDKFVVRKVVGGFETPPVAVADMPSGFDVFGTSHEVEITVSGENHTVLVDGVQYLSFTDDQFTEGYVGFRTWHASDVDFDDIEIEDLSS